MCERLRACTDLSHKGERELVHTLCHPWRKGTPFFDLKLYSGDNNRAPQQVRAEQGVRVPRYPQNPEAKTQLLDLAASQSDLPELCSVASVMIAHRRFTPAKDRGDHPR